MMSSALFAVRKTIQFGYPTGPFCHIFSRSLTQKDTAKYGISTPSLEHMAREQELPFARARLGNFVQEEPKLGNQYLEDSTIQAYLKRYVPAEFIAEIEADLQKFGDRVIKELYPLHLQCEREPPYLEKYTAWGKLQDRLVTGPAWRRMHDIAAEEGLIALSYDSQFAEHSRLYALIKNYLWGPSSGLYSCPLAMTDGAATIIQSLQKSSPGLLASSFSRLTSRDPQMFWTSGQWMTEKRGGSDVANGTETLAVPQSDGTYRLHGYKWFSSATDADITFTLARVVDSRGQAVDGTKGLSLFYIELRDADGQLNNIELIRLKNKLGTRQLPTAELLLDGTVAQKVSDEGRGVAAISDMLKLSRIHNAVMAVSSMRRSDMKDIQFCVLDRKKNADFHFNSLAANGRSVLTFANSLDSDERLSNSSYIMVNLARDYSTRRQAFRNFLKDYPLHIQTIARMEVEVRGAVLLFLENVRMLGREDCGMATEEEKNLLRLLVPLSKLYSGKQALEVSTEGLECFGGQGYIEDTGLPSMLRDAQVLSIWEGTTNILSLDVLRAVAKSEGRVLVAFHSDIGKKLSSVKSGELEAAASRVEQAANDILRFLQDNVSRPGVLEVAARDLAYSLCRTYTGALLIDHACSSVGTKLDVYAAQRWCEKELSLVTTNTNKGWYDDSTIRLNSDLVFDGYHNPSRL